MNKQTIMTLLTKAKNTFKQNNNIKIVSVLVVAFAFTSFIIFSNALDNNPEKVSYNPEQIVIKENQEIMFPQENSDYKFKVSKD